jgi:hypothetical protein
MASYLFSMKVSGNHEAAELQDCIRAFIDGKWNHNAWSYGDGPNVLVSTKGKKCAALLAVFLGQQPRVGY